MRKPQIHFKTDFWENLDHNRVNNIFYFQSWLLVVSLLFAHTKIVYFPLIIILAGSLVGTLSHSYWKKHGWKPHE